MKTPWGVVRYAGAGQAKGRERLILETHLMNDEPLDQSSDELLRLRREAEHNNNGYHTLWGFLVAPVLMGITWYLTGDIKAVRGVGVWIFCIASLVFALAFTRFSVCSDKLKNVSQQYSVMVRGVMGPVKDNYRTQYEFSRFSEADCKVHRKVHFWAVVNLFALFALASWLLAINFFTHFVWK